jgi:hypothetical protein
MKTVFIRTLLFSSLVTISSLAVADLDSKTATQQKPKESPTATVTKDSTKKASDFKTEPANLKEYIQQKKLQQAGGVSTGGGDEYVVDFIQTAQNEVYPWAKENQDLINAEKLLVAINPDRIASVDRVFESCNFENGVAIPQNKNDQERQACYNQHDDFIYLSRAKYPLNVKNSPSKMSIVAHELLRRLKLEGNEYLITGQWNFATSNPVDPISDTAKTAMLRGISLFDDLYNEASELCAKGGDISPEKTIQRIKEIKIQFDTAYKITKMEKLGPASPGRCAMAMSSMLGSGLMDFNILIMWTEAWQKTFVHLPACKISRHLNEAKAYSDATKKSFELHSRGVTEPTPDCIPKLSDK